MRRRRRGTKIGIHGRRAQSPGSKQMTDGKISASRFRIRTSLGANRKLRSIVSGGLSRTGVQSIEKNLRMRVTLLRLRTTFHKLHSSGSGLRATFRRRNSNGSGLRATEARGTSRIGAAAGAT